MLEQGLLGRLNHSWISLAKCKVLCPPSEKHDGGSIMLWDASLQEGQGDCSELKESWVDEWMYGWMYEWIKQTYRACKNLRLGLRFTLTKNKSPKLTTVEKTGCVKTKNWMEYGCSHMTCSISQTAVFVSFKTHHHLWCFLKSGQLKKTESVNGIFLCKRRMVW